MMTRAQLKSLAKQQLKGNLLMLILVNILIILIGSIPFVGFLLAPGLTISMAIICIGLTHGKQIDIGDAFSGIKVLGKAWWLSILISFFTFLWSLLFIIPGFVKSLSYSMAPYILAEHPEMTAREALRLSKDITDGHKMDLFVLNLSFIGWMLLVAFTWGLAALWVVPYLQMTVTNFYNSIKGN